MKKVWKCFFKAEELEYIVSDLYTQISWCYECLGNFMNASAYASKAINLYPKEYNCYRRKAMGLLCTRTI